MDLVLDNIKESELKVPMNVFIPSLFLTVNVKRCFKFLPLLLLVMDSTLELYTEEALSSLVLLLGHFITATG